MASSHLSSWIRGSCVPHRMAICTASPHPHDNGTTVRLSYFFFGSVSISHLGTNHSVALDTLIRHTHRPDFLFLFSNARSPPHDFFFHDYMTICIRWFSERTSTRCRRRSAHVYHSICALCPPHLVLAEPANWRIWREKRQNMSVFLFLVFWEELPRSHVVLHLGGLLVLC